MDETIAIVLPLRDFPGEPLVALTRAIEERGLPSVVAAPERGRCVGVGGVRVMARLALDELRPDRLAAAIVLDGPDEPLARDPRLARLVLEMVRAGRTLGAVGHGVAALASTGLLRGRSVAADEEVADRARRDGAVPLLEPVVVSGGVVTATEAAAARVVDELLELRRAVAPPPPPT